MQRVLWATCPPMQRLRGEGGPGNALFIPHLYTMRIFWLSLFMAVVVGEAAAQGFNTFSGRNHPELQWQVAETDHFRIMYPARLEGIEAEAAAIAEASYAALSANLQVTFDEPIRLYLSDEDEIVNGFAVPLGNGYTNIWVHVNAYAESFTGEHKWLRKVIAHELGHIFHYRAINLRPVHDTVLGARPLTRLWTEGLAQYQTERWDAQRGDRWLRTATLEDRLSHTDGQSLWNGRLLYAKGNSQVRYFATTYGDSTLAALLAHRSSRLFGLREVHDFTTAFRAVTGDSYSDFEERWKRHVSVYYNTLAGQLETPDSLDAPPLPLPAQYVDDVRYSRDTTQVALLGTRSLQRPVRQLWVRDRETPTTRAVAEGSIRAPLAWHPEGTALAYTRTTRGRRGALLNDLFRLDLTTGREQRLTHSRRAAAPTFSPSGDTLAFIGVAGRTANVFLLDLATGTETQLTDFTGNVQLTTVQWHPRENLLVAARFADDRRRDLVLIDGTTGRAAPVTEGLYDDRAPRWATGAAGSRQLVYTSLRDEVPNVFRLDLNAEVVAFVQGEREELPEAVGTTRRATHLATGLRALDWLPADSAFAEGSLIVHSQDTKRRDRLYRVDARRTATGLHPVPPEGYAAWTTHAPPRTIPDALAPNPGLITNRYPYHAWRNLTRVTAVAGPYYLGPRDWGVAGGAAWTEPLGKHALAVGGAVSPQEPWDRSAYALVYLNNQRRPTLGLAAYRTPIYASTTYGTDVLLDRRTSLDLTLGLPLDLAVAPYTGTSLGALVRLVDVEPVNASDLDLRELPQPKTGQQLEAQLELKRVERRPQQGETVHPLSGGGARLQVRGALRALGTDTEFLRGDLAAYRILPGPGVHRLFVYGRAQAQTGRSLPQDYFGFSRTDDIRLSFPGGMGPLQAFTFGRTERVRGHRAFAPGRQMVFGSVEYRVPLVPSLQTQLLGLVRFGGLSASVFADAGVVWRTLGTNGTDRRTGVGGELRSVIALPGLNAGVAVGFAQKGTEVFGEAYETYVRIRTAVPF